MQRIVQSRVKPAVLRPQDKDYKMICMLESDSDMESLTYLRKVLDVLEMLNTEIVTLNISTSKIPETFSKLEITEELFEVYKEVHSEKQQKVAKNEEFDTPLAQLIKQARNREEIKSLTKIFKINKETLEKEYNVMELSIKNYQKLDFNILKNQLHRLMDHRIQEEPKKKAIFKNLKDIQFSKGNSDESNNSFKNYLGKRKDELGLLCNEDSKKSKKILKIDKEKKVKRNLYPDSMNTKVLDGVDYASFPFTNTVKQLSSMPDYPFQEQAPARLEHQPSNSSGNFLSSNFSFPNTTLKGQIPKRTQSHPVQQAPQMPTMPNPQNPQQFPNFFNLMGVDQKGKPLTPMAMAPPMYPQQPSTRAAEPQSAQTGFQGHMPNFPQFNTQAKQKMYQQMYYQHQMMNPQLMYMNPMMNPLYLQMMMGMGPQGPVMPNSANSAGGVNMMNMGMNAGGQWKGGFFGGQEKSGFGGAGKKEE